MATQLHTHVVPSDRLLGEKASDGDFEFRPSVLLDLQLGWLLAANGWVHRIRKGDETGDPSAAEGDATKAAVTRQNTAPRELEEAQVD